MSSKKIRGLPECAALLLAHTWRLDVRGEEHVQRLRAAGIPVIFAVWHGHMLAPLWHRRRQGITLLVSSHRDGRYLAEAASRWGYHVVRGSSTRGGMAGLRRVVRTLTVGGDAAFAPDGPRGPAHVAKRGTVAAAQHSGAAIVPVACAASASWNLRSWDRFLVPWPMARVRIVYGESFHVPRGRGAQARGRTELHARLADTSEQACS